MLSNVYNHCFKQIIPFYPGYGKPYLYTGYWDSTEESCFSKARPNVPLAFFTIPPRYFLIISALYVNSDPLSCFHYRNFMGIQFSVNSHWDKGSNCLNSFFSFIATLPWAYLQFGWALWESYRVLLLLMFQTVFRNAT